MIIKSLKIIFIFCLLANSESMCSDPLFLGSIEQSIKDELRDAFGFVTTTTVLYGSVKIFNYATKKSREDSELKIITKDIIRTGVGIGSGTASYIALNHSIAHDKTPLIMLAVLGVVSGITYNEYKKNNYHFPKSNTILTEKYPFSSGFLTGLSFPLWGATLLKISNHFPYFCK